MLLHVRYFLTDMFYAYLTPDRDLPDEVRALLLVVVAEFAKRLKKTNLVTLLTKFVSLLSRAPCDANPCGPVSVASSDFRRRLPASGQELRQ